MSKLVARQVESPDAVGVDFPQGIKRAATAELTSAKLDAALNELAGKVNSTTASELALKFDKTGGAISGSVNVAGSISTSSNAVRVGGSTPGLGGLFYARKDTGADAWAMGVLGSSGAVNWSLYDVVAGKEVMSAEPGGALTINSTMSVNSPAAWHSFRATSVPASFGSYVKGGTSSVVAYVGTDGGGAIAGGVGDNFVIRATLGHLQLCCDVGSVVSNAPIDLSAATAGQIKFPATQNPSSDPNTFDDYEEGAFTPSANDFTVVGTPSYSGKYTKKGREVTCIIEATSTTSIAATVGVSYFSSLPFLPASQAVCASSDNATVIGNGVVTAGGTVLVGSWAPIANVTTEFTYFV